MSEMSSLSRTAMVLKKSPHPRPARSERSSRLRSRREGPVRLPGCSVAKDPQDDAPLFFSDSLTFAARKVQASTQGDGAFQDGCVVTPEANASPSLYGFADLLNEVDSHSRLFHRPDQNHLKRLRRRPSA
jgi:hypothetical protein